MSKSGHARLLKFVGLAVAVVDESVASDNPRLLSGLIPREGRVYLGGFSAVKKYYLQRGLIVQEIAVKCPNYGAYGSYGESDLAKVRKIFEREARTWWRLDHPNVLPLIGITHELGPIPALITPWMSGGTLTDFLNQNHGQLTMERRFMILLEVASGLRYLHQVVVIHGDLTGSNILLDQHGRIRIADFGLAFVFIESDQSMSIPSHVCAPRWAASELFVHPDRESSRLIPTTKSDIYSFGCVMWQVLSGQIPFPHIFKSTHVIILKFEGKDPLDERPAGLAAEHWEFLQSSWSKQAEARPSADEAFAFVERQLETRSTSLLRI
ncbi:kinase-like protein [Paxillus ammoniavirescens]|nr:kinase-like protein [Paxillus ammoniavirescens]